MQTWRQLSSAKGRVPSVRKLMARGLPKLGSAVELRQKKERLFAGIAEMCRGFRQRNQLSVTDFARRARLPESTIRAIEDGRDKLLLERLIPLAEALGFSELAPLFGSAEAVADKPAAATTRQR